MLTPVRDVVWSAGVLALPSASYNNLSVSDENNLYDVSTFSGTTITGIVPTRPGRPLWLHNSSAATVTLEHESASSNAENRFACPNGVDLLLAAGEGALVAYSPESERWVAFPQNAVPTSSVAGTTFPSSPYDGQAFHRTDLRETFYYDESNSVWYGSLALTLNFGDNATSASGGGQYFLAPGNAQHGSTNGYPIPNGWDHGRLLAAGAAWTGSINGNLFVRQNGTNVLTMASSAADRVEAIDQFIELDANTEIEMAFQFNSGSITNASAWIQAVRAFAVGN